MEQHFPGIINIKWLMQSRGKDRRNMVRFTWLAKPKINHPFIDKL